ncbi:MAG: DinB family protein [Proteobacteria bacterium]|nr:DinB family protein [Pseudomonadota bacterium]
MRALGAKTTPVVARGSRFVFGQSTRDVADFLGLALDHEALPAAELVRRLDRVLAVALRLVPQIPAARWHENVRDRKRSYHALAYHLFRIAESFLEVAAGGELTTETVHSNPPASVRTAADVVAFGSEVRGRLSAWWSARAERALAEPVPTYWGLRPLAEVLERTTWHAAQHVRQIGLMLEAWGVVPADRLGAADLAGLPLPEKVWDE